MVYAVGTFARRFIYIRLMPGVSVFRRMAFFVLLLPFRGGRPLRFFLPILHMWPMRSPLGYAYFIEGGVLKNLWDL